MISSAPVLNIAVLNCGYTSPTIQKHRGQYSDIFAALLRPSLDRVSDRDGRRVSSLNVSGWDTVNQEYPPKLDDIDAIIVSGSPNSSYQDLPWIKKLDAYISYVYANHPSIKLYGSCFGHQIICQSLFRDRGVYVEKNPHGWELGVHKLELTDEFCSSLGAVLPSKSMRLQFLHGDHVITPSGSLPDDIGIIGTTKICQNQGIYQQGRILTLQGHPEFDIWIEKVCLELVGNRVGWEEDFTAAAIASADASDDAQLAADLIIAFFLE